MPSRKIAPLVRKMTRRDALSDTEREVLTGLLGPERVVKAGAVLVAPGDRPSYSTFLISGFCARYNVTSAGGRQLTEINVAGDFIDLHSMLMRQMDHGVVALADSVVAFAQHADLRRLTEQHPHLGRLLWLETVIDGAIHRQWLVTMGQQDAASRLAHLVCELYRRLEAVELATGGRFRIPMTQADLGDVLGLTPIHVNRVLMELRREGLIEWKGAEVTIPDWDRLAMFAEFDATYLRLQSDAV